VSAGVIERVKQLFIQQLVAQRRVLHPREPCGEHRSLAPSRQTAAQSPAGQRMDMCMPLPSLKRCRARAYMTVTDALRQRSCWTAPATGGSGSARCCHIMYRGSVWSSGKGQRYRARSWGWSAMPDTTSWCQCHALRIGVLSINIWKSNAACGRPTFCGVIRPALATGWGLIWLRCAIYRAPPLKLVTHKVAR